MKYEPNERLAGVVYPDPADVQRWHEAGALRDETLAEGFRSAARKHATRDAILWVGGKMTYAQLDEASDRVAAGLLDLGLAPLDRVIFQLSNTPETLIAYIACWKAEIGRAHV